MYIHVRESGRRSQALRPLGVFLIKFLIFKKIYIYTCEGEIISFDTKMQRGHFVSLSVVMFVT